MPPIPAGFGFDGPWIDVRRDRAGYKDSIAKANKSFYWEGQELRLLVGFSVLADLLSRYKLPGAPDVTSGGW